MPAVDRDAVLRGWLERTLGTYPEQTTRFLAGEKDPFRNPVGQAYKEGLPVLLDEVLGGMDAERIDRALDNIVRIRAVEQRPPSEAVGFILILKSFLPEREKRIDELALRAFNVYMQCREKLWEIRLTQARRRA
ncbi:MAG: RsbRD N-terminal domain-containing protein [Bryobacteraceae bacterium]